jgi:ABC-type nitrate/sulfonate/bicarbonate transport system substrate-binding protein
MKSFKLLFIIGIFILLTAFTSCSGKDTDLRKVTVLLDWTPNTNHTGLYVAQEKGYFKAEGLEVEIIQPSGGTVDMLVASGSADFGVSYQESVTFARVENVPIVSIAAVIQHNTSGFASLKQKGILSPYDFEGKKYGGWGSDIEKAMITYLMKNKGADPAKVEILTTGDADFFQASSRGDIDFAWIFEGWAGIEAKIRGIDINYIDLGKEAQVFDYYTPVLITSEKIIKDEPSLVKKFMKAVSKGYEYAVENPDNAAAALLNAAPELDEQLVRDSQVFLSPKYKEDAGVWGMQKAEVWERYMTWLFDNDFIARKINVEDAFTNVFIEN